MPKSSGEVEQLRGFIKGLPKIELHAHLSGSIRESTVVELIHQHYTPDEVEKQIKVCKLKADDPNEKRDLNECFALFKVLHKIVSSKDILRRITFEVLEDFVFHDRVMYLELRTTPRAITKTLPNGVITEVCSKYDYIATICEAMQEFKAAVAFINTYLHTTNPDIASPTMPSVGNSILPWVNDESESAIVSSDGLAGFSTYAKEMVSKHILRRSAAFWFVDSSLLLSIDRSAEIEDAEDTLELAVKARCAGFPVSGLDFSGNPYNRSFHEFAHVFQKARAVYGFPISLHFAETPNIQDSVDILAFGPDRVGHAAVLNESLYDQLVAQRIPVEICLTSNASCKLHALIHTHPLLSLYRHRHPLILCTDDKGVFGSTLNDEWLQLLQLHHFNHTGGVDINNVQHCITHFPIEEAHRIGSKLGLDNPLNPLPSPSLASTAGHMSPFRLPYAATQIFNYKTTVAENNTKATAQASLITGLSLQTNAESSSVIKVEPCTCPHSSSDYLLTSSIMPASAVAEPSVPRDLFEAKEALWLFANNGIAACFAKPAVKAHMQNIMIMFKP